MKKNYTDLTFVLDRSGSMSSTAAEVIGGFNRMVKDQIDEFGECRVSLVQFDDVYQQDYIGVLAQNVVPLTSLSYVPRGMTALHDAIGRTVVNMGQRFAQMKESERPEKVMLVIMTDGYENSSKEYNAAKIKAMIEEQQSKYSWQINFIGANQDAVTTAQSFGISMANAATYAGSGISTAAVFDVMANNTKLFRSGAKLDMSYTDADLLKVSQ